LKLFFFLALALMFSCRSSQELIYLQDAANSELIKGLPIESTEHILKSGDILYISIKSINQSGCNYAV